MRSSTSPAVVLGAAIMLAAAGCSSGATGATSSLPQVSGTAASRAPSGSPTSAISPSGATRSSNRTATGAAPTPSASTATEVSPAGDIPDTAVYVVHKEPAAHYTIKVLEGWAQSTAGSASRFTDKLNSITLSTHAAAVAPTVAGARASTVAELQASEPKVTVRDITAVTRRAGVAVLVHYERDSAPNDVTGKVFREEVFRYEFFHAGAELDVVLAGPTGADNVDPWRIVTDSVTWTR